MQHPDGVPVLLSVGQIAHDCGVSRHTVYRWIGQGMPTVRVDGMRLRVSLDSCVEWLKAHEDAA